MGTKNIPFDLETVKKIQDGKTNGQIKTRDGRKARILCTDLHVKYPVAVAVLQRDNDNELLFHYCPNGSYGIDDIKHKDDLVLEVPDNEPQFKPFDKVRVRNKSNERWHPSLYATTDGLLYYTIDCKNWCQCVKYEGNEHLVGTTDKPKEE